MSDTESPLATPRETRSGTPISKTIKKPETTIRKPRKWKKKWVKVGHMQLLKWIPGTVVPFIFLVRHN